MEKNFLTITFWRDLSRNSKNNKNKFCSFLIKYNFDINGYLSGEEKHFNHFFNWNYTYINYVWAMIRRDTLYNSVYINKEK